MFAFIWVICFAGQTQNITHISVQGILPDTSQFMTYEGSTTMPGCHETVTWIVLNKPIYITKNEVRKRLLSSKDILSDSHTHTMPTPI